MLPLLDIQMLEKEMTLIQSKDDSCVISNNSIIINNNNNISHNNNNSHHQDNYSQLQ